MEDHGETPTTLATTEADLQWVNSHHKNWRGTTLTGAELPAYRAALEIPSEA